jgi:ATP-dependent DNA helicase RecQ
VAVTVDELQNALLGSGGFPDSTARDPLAGRIRSVVTNAGGRSNARAELPPLLRQYLLRETWREGRDAHLRVPNGPQWPKAKDWADHGVRALAVGRNELSVTADQWCPDWLPGGRAGVFGAAFTEELVRADGRCAADPFLTEATGYTHYSCPGQREAVRAAFLMRPGTTLIVNLPTGSGKSLVGQAPALVYKEEGNLTIFVVPTVALAIDQARQMSVYLKRAFGAVWPLAWHGGTSSEQRASIRERLRRGTQRIIFTSPEALLTSLLRTVEEVAKAGMLRYLVIDEAHLITQWGDEFRPAFQTLAGLRSALLREAPHGGFRTLLLSATFTSTTVDAIAGLFGPNDNVQVVSAVHLRPEPQYWIYQAASRADKKNRVLTALRFAPRPFILYVTERKEAIEWLSALQTEAGLRRVDVFHGGTPDDARERIIKQWINNDLDGVVATSAFGVGIDKNDVRTIVHATIPETLDRYYQEVGRSGRDGHPSASLLVFDNTDWGKPERLAKAKIITDELGINRWRALYESRPHGERADLVPINIEAIPKHAVASSEYNIDWNMRTLLLMSRAGIVRLEVDSSNTEAQQPILEFSSSTPLAAMARVRVHILDDGHLLDNVWERRVGPARERSYNAGVKNLRLIRDLLIRGREMGETLSELYRIETPQWPVDVTRVCGGCPADRYQPAVDYQMPVAAPIHRTVATNARAWRERFPGLAGKLIHVFYDGDSTAITVQRAIAQLASWLVASCDIREVVTAEDSPLQNLSEWRQLYRRSIDGVVIHRFLNQVEEPYSPIARLSVLRPHDTSYLETTNHVIRPFHVVLCHGGTSDPANPKRLLRHTAKCGILLDTVLEKLGQ